MVRSLGASVGVAGELSVDDPSREVFWVCTGEGFVSTVGRAEDEDVVVVVVLTEELLTTAEPDFESSVLTVVDDVDVVDDEAGVSFATCALQSLTMVLASLETSASTCVFILLTNRPISVFYGRCHQ